MKTFFFIFTTVIALGVATPVQEVNHRLTALELANDEEVPRIFNKETAIEGRSLSSKGQKRLENFINHLPCGWPEAGIPPLAPYTKEQIVIKLKESFAEFFAKLEHFRIDGLDIMLVNKLKISYTLSQNVKFDLTFPRITISGKYLTDVVIDLMNEYGINVRYDGNGDFVLVLENINFKGYFKYKMPIIFGSIRIYKFDGSITLGGVVSQINGILPEGKYSELLNEKIEETLMKVVDYNQPKISEKLEESLVPFLNEKLKGKKIWTIIGSIFSGKGKKCYPLPDPWA